MPTYPKLDRPLRVDALVVGGGVTGLTAAYLLTLSGRSVALIERERCASIDTGHTSAHLTMVTDRSLTALAKEFGADHARAVWDAGLAAIGEIDQVMNEESIDCDFAFVPGHLFSGEGRESADDPWLEEEATFARELGFDVSFDADLPLVHRPGIRYEDQARIHPRKYLAGLARAIVARGGMIFEHTSAGEFSRSPRSVKANGHEITCHDIIMATHTPLTGNTPMTNASHFQTKLALYTSYVVAGRVKKGAVPDALLWDTADPYHYIRLEPHREHDLVIYGGEDHKTGQVDDTAERYARLEKGLRALVPPEHLVEITHHWSGQVIQTPDGLPYIGRTAEHQFAATGFSGNGLTFGTLGGMMAADRVCGRKNPWAELFDPARTVVHGVWDYLAENKDYPYYRIRDWFTTAAARSVRSVRRGQGKVIEHRGQQVAAYRDPEGHVTLRSANCSHMGCLVDWNTAERTWDCPCHGSRFKPDGGVISGPANAPLDDVKD